MNSLFLCDQLLGSGHRTSIFTVTYVLIAERTCVLRDRSLRTSQSNGMAEPLNKMIGVNCIYRLAVISPITLFRFTPKVALLQSC